MNRELLSALYQTPKLIESFVHLQRPLTNHDGDSSETWQNKSFQGAKQ